MSMGPLLVLSMARLNAVEKWKSLVGPYKTLQAEWFLPLNVKKRFGMHIDIPDALHASENLKDANRETRYFYPNSTYYLCEISILRRIIQRSECSILNLYRSYFLTFL